MTGFFLSSLNPPQDATTLWRAVSPALDTQRWAGAFQGWLKTLSGLFSWQTGHWFWKARGECGGEQANSHAPAVGKTTGILDIGNPTSSCWLASCSAVPKQGWVWPIRILWFYKVRKSQGFWCRHLTLLQCCGLLITTSPLPFLEQDQIQRAKILLRKLFWVNSSQSAQTESILGFSHYTGSG